VPQKEDESSLAAQTLSVADAIEYCDKTLNLPEFKGSEATVAFIRSVDRVFDFLNSRNTFGKGFKAPLHVSNEMFWRSAIQKEIFDGHL
jgi:putative heme iron utilization protein